MTDVSDYIYDSGLLVDEVRMTMPEQDSDINVGTAPLIAHFSTMTPLGWNKWRLGGYSEEYVPEFGHAYWVPKPKYDVAAYDVALNDIEIEKFITVYAPAEISYTHLQIKDASLSHKHENWSNAIDGDTYGANGTANVTGNKENEKPWAIFEFTDQKTKKVAMLRMMNDTGVGNLANQVGSFDVMVSTTGIAAADFKALLSGNKTNNYTNIFMEDDWMEWKVDPPVDAKYIKLVINTPEGYWRQLGEFEVYEKNVLADAKKSSIKASGNPASDGVAQVEITLSLADAAGAALGGRTAHDLRFFSIQKEGTPGIENECSGTDLFSPIVETATAGVYKVMMTSVKAGTKYIKASASGVIIDKTEANGAALCEVAFGQPVIKPVDPGPVSTTPSNKLVFLEGTPTQPTEGWDNLVDNDCMGWDGTVTAKGTPDPRGPAWGIFKFEDDGIYMFNGVAIQTDNGCMDKKYPARHASVIQIWASETGKSDADFTLAATIYPKTCWWKEYVFPNYIKAKYLKIALVEPRWADGAWRQIVELTLMAKRNEGAILASEAVNELAALPQSSGLEQNYPNPFNPETAIHFSLAADEHVSLKVFASNGREVATLIDGEVGAGFHTIAWNGRLLPSGIYFCRMVTPSYTSIKRMMLIK